MSNSELFGSIPVQDYTKQTEKEIKERERYIEENFYEITKPLYDRIEKYIVSGVLKEFWEEFKENFDNDYISIGDESNQIYLDTVGEHYVSMELGTGNNVDNFVQSLIKVLSVSNTSLIVDSKRDFYIANLTNSLNRILGTTMIFDDGKIIINYAIEVYPLFVSGDEFVCVELKSDEGDTVVFQGFKLESNIDILLEEVKDFTSKCVNKLEGGK